MDWPQSTDPLLTAFPAGRQRDGGRLGPVTVVAENALQWTSRFASLVTTVYGIGTADGMNERGLAAHLLYLRSTVLPERDVAVPGLHIGLWAQYLLDMAASVSEALDLLAAVELVMVDAQGFAATVHLAIEDATGDSAIVEFVGGERVVHHAPEYTLMTNDPGYDEQLALLAQLDFSVPSAEVPLPGNVSATDRFQRAAYFAALLPDVATEREAVAGVLAVIRNASVPFGTPHGASGVFSTEYRTVCDLTHLRYFFELTTSPNVLWTDLAALDLPAGSSPLVLDPDSIALNGEVSGQYAAAQVAF